MMKIVYKNDPNFEIYWSNFVTINKSGWRYLPGWINYQKLYSKKNLKTDFSFVVVKSKKTLAICPLFLESYSGIKVFTYSKGYQNGPIISNEISEKQRTKVEKICFKIIDNLVQTLEVSKCMIQLDPLQSHYKYNALNKYGYFDASIQTCVIDLNLEKNKLWSNIRKSYKAIINNGLDHYDIVVSDRKNPDFEMHECYRKLHHKTAGRVTRPIETFQQQFEDLKRDNAMLIGLRDSGKFIAFSYFLHDNKTAYYGSSSDDPDYNSSIIPLEHCIIWSAISYYKKRGFCCLDLGLQQFSQQIFDQPTEKDISISFFKRGFGGNILPFYRGVKYFDRNIMIKELGNHIQQLFNKIE